MTRHDKTDQACGNLTSGSWCFFTKSISGTEQLATSSIWIVQSGSMTKHVNQQNSQLLTKSAYNVCS